MPTTLEAGFANAEYPIWLGIFLPVKTPRVIVDKLHRETLKALQAMKAANEEILKQQIATLEKLDEIEKAANEIRIYTKRG